MRISNIFNKKTVVGLLTAVILTITSFALAKNAVAMPPFAVGLIDFTATPQNNAALLEWETATELGTAGFGIQRRQNSDAFVTISGFINAVGDGAAGASYSYLDETAVNGQTYTYQLIEYEAGDGQDNELEQVEVTIGIQPTATPVTIGGGGSSNNATATPVTTNATSTPRATARAGEPTATTRATTTSPTVMPTSQTTAVSTANSTTTRTASSSPTPAAVSVSSNNGSTVFAQGDNTPTPQATAYPASTTENDSQPAASTPYPADDTQPIIVETATAYPAIEKSTGVDNTADSGTNVIGSGAEGNSDNSDNADESASSSTFALWAGFIVALLIFIAGLVGTAVLLTRKK